jgi:hypothetical protein
VETEDTRDLLRERADLTDTALQQRVTAETTVGVARLAPETRIAEGERAELVVDTRRLYFFDLERGLVLGEVDSGDARVVVASGANAGREGNGPVLDG